MKKLRILLVTILCLSMLLSVVGCDMSDSGGDSSTENTPTVSITSSAETIELGEGYTLAYTTTDSTSETVAITDSDGESYDSEYDSSTKVFTPTKTGDYTIKVTATNVSLTATDSVAVTVEDKDADIDAPSLSYASDLLDSYSFVAGGSVTLPLATATDEIDGDVDVDVSLTSSGATLTKNDNGYVFSSLAASKYYVSYYAVDKAGNEVEEFVEINCTPVNAESVLDDGANEISNLNTSGMTFVENFEDGYSSDLAKGLVYGTGSTGMNSYIGATEDAIAGNSLFIDYSNCSYDSNTGYYFSPMTSYLKSGKWEISVDVEVVSGTMPNQGIFLSYIYEGDESGDNQQYTLTSGVNTLTFDGIKTFDSSKTWYFRTFLMCTEDTYSYNGLVLAFDNFSFTWTDVVDATATRTTEAVTITADDLDGDGYTITGADDNYTKLAGSTVSATSSSGLYMYADKLVSGDRLTTEQAENLTPANGFNSDYVIYMASQITSFASLSGLATDSGYKYTLTLSLYSPSAAGWNFFFTDGSGTQVDATGIADFTGAKEVSYEFTGSASFINLGMYKDGQSPIYVGDITLSRKEISVDATATRTGSGVTVSADDLDGDGYTITGADDNYTALAGNSTSACYLYADKLVDAEYLTEDQSANLTSANGFNSDYVIYMASGVATFEALNNLATDSNYTYTVTMSLYVVEAYYWHIYLGGTYVQQSDISSAEIKELTYSFTGSSTYTTLGIDVSNSAKIFIGDITLSRVARVVGDTTTLGYSVGQTWTFSADDASFSPAGGSSFEKVTTSDITALSGDTTITTASLYKTELTGNATNVIMSCGNYMETSCDYKITLVIYVESLNGGDLLFNFDNSAFPSITSTTGVQTITIQKSGVVDNMSFYTVEGVTATVYLSSVTIELTAIN